MFFWNVIGYRMHPQFPPAIHSDVFGPRVDFFSILSIFVLYLYNNKWPNFWCFEVFISAKCIYRIYLAYLYFILSKKRILPFSFFGDFLAILQISQNSGIFQPRKMFPKFENSTVDMDFSFMGCFLYNYQVYIQTNSITIA